MEAYRKALRGNIWRIYALFGIRGSLVHVGILVLFLQHNGLSLQEVFILQGSWSALQVILEIPSGYLSDRWGRKPTVLIGTVCKCLGALSYCLGTNFWEFFLAMCFFSTGSSLYSGTVEALTYDTLLELDEEKQYRNIAGKQGFFQFGTEAFASILGGFLALISLRAPLWGTLLFFSIGPILAIGLCEPRRHKLQETRHFAAMWNIFQVNVVRHTPIRCLLLLSSIFLTMTFGLHWFTQPYEEMVGLPLYLFGVTHAVIVFSHAIASRYAHTLERWIDDRLLLLIIAAVTVACFLALGIISALWGILFFFIVRVMWGLTSPVISEMLNRMTTSDIRATVLSFRSLGFRLMFAAVSPLLGVAADVFTVNQAILITGCIGGAAMIMTFVAMHSVWEKMPK